VRDRLLSRQHSVHDLAELFWSIGSLDSETLAVLDAWLHSGDETRFREVLRLIVAGPEDLVFKFPFFAIHVVHSAAEFGDGIRQKAFGGFISRTQRRTWDGTPSKAPAKMVELRDSAAELAHKMANVPEGARLFSSLAEVLSRDITSWRPPDEE
jgi:hypothetical protein